ncbi:protein NDRG3 [Eurytemora carolleeae]|uniref:protein NDRG3 n=1 Tax=Eurytemora carolleeae TaxID=1294199 RepID=UPI000C756CA7|nr:protein NDRG3 [Eurytemora carolleeae]|eukprot:XP_023338144.1 protein NDRG3-like [Eurytemora affinis]
MPSQNTMLLADPQDDVELRNLAVVDPLDRTLSKDTIYTEETVETSTGPVLVAFAGDRTKPALLTYHDLGLNYVSNFQAFFNYPEMKEICQSFCVFHVNAPGQEEGALLFPEECEFPTMEQLGEQIQEVLNHFSLVRYIGIGVGLGANVLVRHALAYPERVDCLMLINTQTTKAGWMEWGYQKRNVSHLRTTGVTQPVLDYLLWHHLGQDYTERSHDLVNVYKHYFEKDVQGINLAKLVEQFIWRTDIPLDRLGATLEVPVLNLVGIYSPFIDDTVTFNGRLAPSKTNWIKIQEAAMVLEEQPGKVSEAFRLFLQGQGYCLKIRKIAVQ